MIRGLGQDLIYGLRMLARSPGVALSATLTLGLGIGLSTAVFSIAAPMIAPRPPFDDPGARVLEGLLYDTSPTDPLTLVATCLALLGVAWLATLLPARRATRVDPLAALR